MKIYIFSGALLLLFGLSIFYIFFTDANISNYPPKNNVIVAFGDSLVFGQGATVDNDFVSVLSRSLGRDIINLGVSGNTTVDGLARVKEVTALNPGVVILLLGGNDYLRRISKEETKANLEVLIKTFVDDGSVVVLLGVRGGVIRDGRKDMYRELSAEYGTVYVSDVLDGILLKPELMSDGVHPNDAGYSRIAERIHKAFLTSKL